MNNTLTYKTSGTCSRSISVTVDGDTIESVKFEGGCAGNTAGVASLVAGMKIDEAIKRLKGIKCGFKPTSCPDQLALALEKIKATANV
ncbi:MAG: TIGR03905 family TSCPD domain-containing protein [Clostridiales bacterium]|nr:TIGR03905 family TSCPD domain-containing protein [Clostridiales bacterium]